jgi:hypothetical protein
MRLEIDFRGKDRFCGGESHVGAKFGFQVKENIVIEWDIGI